MLSLICQNGDQSPSKRKNFKNIADMKKQGTVSSVVANLSPVGVTHLVVSILCCLGHKLKSSFSRLLDAAEAKLTDLQFVETMLFSTLKIGTCFHIEFSVCYLPGVPQSSRVEGWRAIAHARTPRNSEGTTSCVLQYECAEFTFLLLWCIVSA